MRRFLVWPPLALAVGIAALAAGGVAYAVIPDADGTVHACLKTKGQVYVIDPKAGATCGKDPALDWNQTGAAGLQGVDGPKGFTGGQGTAGTSGYEQQHAQFSTDGNGDGTGEADCPSGKAALAGGYELTTGLKPLHTGPKSDGSGWAVSVTGTANAAFLVYAVCATNGGS